MDELWHKIVMHLPTGWWMVGIFRMTPTGNFAAVVKAPGTRGLDYDGVDTEVRGIGQTRMEAITMLWEFVGRGDVDLIEARRRG